MAGAPLPLQTPAADLAAFPGPAACRGRAACRSRLSRPSMALSPWTDAAVLVSPDGRCTARITDAMEIAMGGPTAGELRLSNGFRLSGCSPAMVWSDDSAYLAVPQWTRTRSQRLAIVSVHARTVHYGPGEYRVLQLERFEGGLVQGVDSPIHRPRRVQWRVSDVVG